MKRLALLLPLALAVGCGGGTTPPPGGVSKAAYLGQAEAICAKANADQKALKTPSAIGELAPYVAKVVALADSATQAVDALEPPRADRADVQAKVLQPLKAQLVEGHTYAAKVAVAAQKGDQKALVSLLSNPPTGSKADLRWMRSYGFVECVKSADTSG